MELDPAELGTLLMLGHRERTGPVAAALASLRRAGVQTDLHHTSWVGAHGRTLDEPLAQPRGTVKQFLLASFQRSQMACAGKRRKEFDPLRAGVDRWASCKALRSAGWTESSAAALRSVMSGSLVCEELAQRWNGGSKVCPFCQEADQTPFHRWWVCSAWEHVRTQHLRGWTLERLRAALPPVALTHGWLPQDPALERSRRAVEQECGFPPVWGDFHRAWSDGSATDPTDPELRRAAWAVVWWDGSRWHRQASPCPGRQTVGRAELAAMIWAARAAPEGLLLTVDSKYVWLRVRVVRDGKVQQLLDGADADLWQLVTQLPSLSIVRWMPSHASYHEAMAKGVEHMDWVGNFAADDAAKSLARRLAVDSSVATQRRQQVRALSIAQAVIAHVQEAVLECEHHTHRRVFRKRRATPLFASRRVKRRAAVRPQPAVIAVPEEAPAGLHAPVVQSGPLTLADSQRPPAAHFPHWSLHCARCSRSVAGTSRWTAFCRSPCVGGPPGLEFRRALHELQRVPGGWQCQRCALPATSSRRAAMAAATCRVPEVWVGQQRSRPHERWLRHLDQLTAQWKAVRAPGRPARGPARQEGGAGGPPAAAGPPPVGAAAPGSRQQQLGLVPWLDHLPVAGARTGRHQFLCLHCGATASKRKALMGSPRPRVPADGRQLALALGTGLYDRALRDAFPAVRELAARAGWQPLGEATEAASGDTDGGGVGSGSGGKRAAPTQVAGTAGVSGDSPFPLAKRARGRGAVEASGPPEHSGTGAAAGPASQELGFGSQAGVFSGASSPAGATTLASRRQLKAQDASQSTGSPARGDAGRRRVAFDPLVQVVVVPEGRGGAGPGTSSGASASSSSGSSGPRSRLLRALGATTAAAAGTVAGAAQPYDQLRLAGPTPESSTQDVRVASDAHVAAVPVGQVPQGTDPQGLVDGGPPGPAPARPPAGGVRAPAVDARGDSDRIAASAGIGARTVAERSGQVPQGAGAWDLGAADPLGSGVSGVPPSDGTQGPAAAGSGSRASATSSPS